MTDGTGAALMKDFIRKGSGSSRQKFSFTFLGGYKVYLNCIEALESLFSRSM